MRRRVAGSGRSEGWFPFSTLLSSNLYLHNTVLRCDRPETRRLAHLFPALCVATPGTAGCVSLPCCPASVAYFFTVVRNGSLPLGGGTLPFRMSGNGSGCP